MSRLGAEGARHESQAARQEEPAEPQPGITCFLARVLTRRRAKGEKTMEQKEGAEQKLPQNSCLAPAPAPSAVHQPVTGVVEGISSSMQHLQLPLVSSLLSSPPQLRGPGSGPPMELMLVSTSPRILLIDNFLDKDTCDALISLAAPNLKRSLVGSLDNPGYISPSRTSQSWSCSAFNAPRMKRQLEERITRLTGSPEVRAAGGLPLRPAEGEGIEVIRYQCGERFLEHYDNRAGTSPRRRAATLIMYLNTAEEGGAIYFPACCGAPRTSTPLSSLPLTSTRQHDDSSIQRPGLRVYPQRGRAILFWSCTADGIQDRHSRHASEPILKGDKWISTQFFTDLP